MDCVTVTATLVSPLITRGFLTLDGILAAQVFDRTGDVETAHRDLPLVCTDGLWHASAALYEPRAHVPVAITGGLRAQHTFHPEWIKRNSKGRTYRSLADSEFGNVMTNYRAVEVDSVTWYAEGDADAIRGLLEPIRAIGARRQAGFGQVDAWTFEDGDLDGVLGYDDLPLRPVPVELWRGSDDAVIGDAAWRPAYWDPRNLTACALPS